MSLFSLSPPPQLSQSNKFADEQCDTEVGRINETMLTPLTPAAARGIKNLQVLVARQQREAGEGGAGVPWCEPLLQPAPMLLLSPAEVLDTNSETSNETEASVVRAPPLAPSLSYSRAVDVVDLSELSSVPPEKLRQIRDLVMREEARRSTVGNVVAAPKKAAAAATGGGGGGATKAPVRAALTQSHRLGLGLEALTQSHPAPAPRPRSAQSHSYGGHAKAPSSSSGGGHAVHTNRRNSKDKGAFPQAQADHGSLRRSFTTLEDELPFPFDTEDAVGHDGEAGGGIGSSHDGGGLLRQGAIPPNFKMFESGRDFRDLGTSPNRLPSFGDAAKHGEPRRLSTVKPTRPRDARAFKKYYGEDADHDAVPVMPTLTEQLAFVNSKADMGAGGGMSGMLNVSPATAFDDCSQGSQSTASSSSGRGVDQAQPGRQPVASALSRRYAKALGGADMLCIKHVMYKTCHVF